MIASSTAMWFAIATSTADLLNDALPLFYIALGATFISWIIGLLIRGIVRGGRTAVR